jgi:hypothetical protein
MQQGSHAKGQKSGYRDNNHGEYIGEQVFPQECA